MLSVFQLVVGFMMLIYGADLFVANASNLALKLGVSSLVIGLTIVAFGTSAPELAVSVSAALQESNEIALGNVLGSNLFNLLIVVGFSCLIAPLIADKELLKRDWPACILSTLLVLGLLIFDHHLSRIDGLILWLGFFFITYLQLRHAKSSTTQTIESPTISCKVYVMILLGFSLIVLGADISVQAAIKIAYQLGLSESFVGLTIVSIGTSLPELVTSMVATRKKEYNIAIGNVIGSNLFNVLFILGTTCILNPIGITSFSIIDTLWVLIVTLVLFIIAKKSSLNKNIGFLMIILYIIYTYTLWIR